jgi:hypothetical protein
MCRSSYFLTGCADLCDFDLDLIDETQPPLIGYITYSCSVGGISPAVNNMFYLFKVIGKC